MTADNKRDEKSGQVLAGNTLARPGSRKGIRNRLHVEFIADIQESWARNGKAALEILFREDTPSYARLVGSVLPKEFIIETSNIEVASDEEIDETIQLLRAEQARLVGSSGPVAVDPGGGTAKAKRKATAQK